MPFKKIVLALNGVDEETSVIKKAFELSKVLGSSISVLHVNDPDAGHLHMTMDYFPKVSKNDLTDFIIKSGFEKELAQIEIQVLEGANPVASLVSATLGADLLIMGHHKKNFLMALATDSTDEKVADHIDCPMLLIPIK